MLHVQSILYYCMGLCGSSRSFTRSSACGVWLLVKRSLLSHHHTASSILSLQVLMSKIPHSLNRRTHLLLCSLRFATVKKGPASKMRWIAWTTIVGLLALILNDQEAAAYSSSSARDASTASRRAFLSRSTSLVTAGVGSSLI